MKRFNQFCTLFCILTVNLALGACTLESSSVAVQPAETSQLPQSDLEAILQVPTTLPDGDSVELEFTLINHSETSLYVLKWYTPLEGLAGEIFRIERDGQVIPYQGILATRVTPPPEAYVLLEPGEALSAEVDLATAYDFSKSGEYTIEFLSPSISHVARTEAEMAKTLNDLGPVQIPSKRVSVTIANASDLPVRWTPAEAAEMIRGYLQSQKPDLNPDFRLPLEELPMHEAWEYMRVQVFRITEGTFVNESFLISGDTMLRLGTAVGGPGLTSMEVSDLDRDGGAELLFTYGFGSGIHQSRIGMYAPAYDKNRIYEAGTAYLGDTGLFKEDMSNVGVRVVESDNATGVLRYSDTLGHLAIHQHENQVRLVLQVAWNLPDDLRQNLTVTSAPTQTGDETSTVVYEGISFTFDHAIAADVMAETVPATDEQEPRQTTKPAHVWFSLNGYVLPETLHKPRIVVYPVAEFEAISEYVGKTIADLRQLLVDRPAAPKAIPFLPPFHAGQMMRAQVAYVGFQNGTGVRFLTQYAQAYLPVNNHELFYTFQGLTDDGNVYVAAILPVSHPTLPTDQMAYEGDLDILVQNFDTYIAEVEEQLNAQDTSSFTPDLSLLDAMIQSLEVAPAWTTAVPPAAKRVDDPYPGWESYVNEQYGFAFRHPGAWALHEGANEVRLSRGRCCSPGFQDSRRFDQ